MDIDRLKRLLIGPIALLFIGLIVAWNYKPDPRFLAPLHMQNLSSETTSVKLPERGRYAVYYAFPLEVSEKSGPHEVERSVHKSKKISDAIKEIDTSTAVLTNPDGKTLLPGKTIERLLYKQGNPPRWVFGRPLCAFNVFAPGDYKVSVKPNSDLKQHGGSFFIGSLTRPDTSNSF